MFRTVWKYLGILLLLCIAGSVFLLSRNRNEKSSPEEKTKMEYTYYNGLSFRARPWYENAEEDVITPYIEERFGISVSKVYYNNGLSFKERFHQLVANDELPDVITVQVENSSWVANSGFYMEMGPLIEEYMPNLLKWCPKEEWKDALIDGKLYGIPNPFIDVQMQSTGVPSTWF